MSDCEATREQLLDSLRGNLSEAREARIAEHLGTCAECRRLFERERALDRALSQRPAYALPESLRAKLSAHVNPPQNRPRAVNVTRRVALVASAFAVAALALFVARSWFAPDQTLITEAVNDHLRVVYAEHPIEIESGGIHQVKPWFTGRLDFAPPIRFSGDDEFPMSGGAVGLFVDRKAATFIFKHRLHTLTLFVFRNESLPFPLHPATPIGPIGAPSTVVATSATARGFNVLLWREGDLGYALVSDADRPTLLRLATKLTSH
jgi:anti-sigma factor RsiW